MEKRPVIEDEETASYNNNNNNNNEKNTSISIGGAICEGRNVIKKEAKKFLKCKYFT